MNFINILVTTCGENEYYRLITFLNEQIGDHNQYKLWVLVDDSIKDEVLQEVTKYVSELDVIIVKHKLNNNFAEHRNYIHEYIAKGEWILQLDSDEMINKIFLKNLPKVLEYNEDNGIELFYLPRNNYVNGITEEYIRKMGWRQDEEGRINYPDLQGRLYKLTENIKWENKVHEKVKGAKKYGVLKEEWCHIEHIKSLDKQKEQNNFYEEIGE